MKFTGRAAALVFLLLALPGLAPAAGDPPLAERVLTQLNRVRKDPAKYADYLASLRPRYRADGTFLGPGDVVIRTREGVAGLDDAIRALRRAAPVGPLTASAPLAQSAQEYAAEQARTGAIGHGSNLSGRLSRHGQWLDAAAENIAYGSTTPERTVADLIIDDGRPDRGHRANILNGAFRVVGVGVARHPRYGVVCVIDFAGGFNAR